MGKRTSKERRKSPAIKRRGEGQGERGGKKTFEHLKLNVFCQWTCIVFLLCFFSTRCDLAGELQVPMSFSEVPQANMLSD